jgi:hypothetical protein
MKRSILIVALLAGAQLTQAQQLQIGRVDAVDFQTSASRGTDTLFTFGIEQASAQGQIAAYVSPAGAMLFGTSEYPTNAFAQEFELIDGPANIDGVVFFFAQAVYGSAQASSHIKVRLYAMDAAGGQTSAGAATRPGTVLREVQLPISQITTTGFSGVSFAPVWVSSRFAAGFSLTGINTADSVNLAASTNGFVEISDRSWLTLSGAWATVKLAAEIDIDYFIGAVLTPSAVSVGENAWMNGMQMDILGGNPNRDAFTLRYAVRDASDMRLYVVDAMGRTMVDEQLGRQSGENQRYVNTQGWAAGTYFVNLMANGLPITKRVVVE